MNEGMKQIKRDVETVKQRKRKKEKEKEMKKKINKCDEKKEELIIMQMILVKRPENTLDWQRWNRE